MRGENLRINQDSKAGKKKRTRKRSKKQKRKETRCEDKDGGGSWGYTPNDNPPTHTYEPSSISASHPSPAHYPLPSSPFPYPTIDPASTPPPTISNLPSLSTPHPEAKSPHTKDPPVSAMPSYLLSLRGYLCEMVRYYRRNGGIGKLGRAEGDGRGGMRAK